MEARIEDGNLVLVLAIEKHESKSGKSTLVVETQRFEETTAEIDGKPVIVNLTAFISK